MKWELTDKALHSDFTATVEKLSGQNVSDCYQCGKCSGGCPVLGDLEFSPNQVIRMVQLGLEEEVLNNEMVWGCAGCNTCNGRCPMGIDIVSIMDTLRAIAERKKSDLPGKASKVWTFYRAFLGSVREFGRLSEVGLMGGYNINSGYLLTNVIKSPYFILKNKISLKPHKIKRIDRLHRVFERVKEMEDR